MNLLCLLIGGNNIANYALIEYFKNNEDATFKKVDCTVLIYSSKTKELAINIKTLQKDMRFIDIDLKDEQRSLLEIKEKITNALDNLENVSSIHLNYTGGTKSMSIGAYLAVEEFEKEYDTQVIYSDISPINYRLSLSNGEHYPLDGSSLSDKLNIPIKDFFILHNLKIPQKSKKKLSQFYTLKFIEFLLKQKEGFYEDIWDRKDISKLEWKKSLRQISYETEQIKTKKALKKLQKFIRGVFLEEYLFDVLTEIKREVNITDLAWSVEAKTKDTKDFEIDVIAICGYKAYIFSCTTQTNTTIKQKAFEANQRAEQIAGRGATTVLVTLAQEKEIEGVQKDMSHIEKTFYAVGIQSLQDKQVFKKRLKEIFR